MAITHSRRSRTINRIRIHRRIEVMQLLCEEKCSDQNTIPATSLVRQGGETLVPDPFQEVHESGIRDAVVDFGAELGDALLLERHGGLLDEVVLVAIASVVKGLVERAVVAAGGAGTVEVARPSLPDAETVGGEGGRCKTIKTGEGGSHIRGLHGSCRGMFVACRSNDV